MFYNQLPFDIIAKVASILHRGSKCNQIEEACFVNKLWFIAFWKTRKNNFTESELLMFAIQRYSIETIQFMHKEINIKPSSWVYKCIACGGHVEILKYFHQQMKMLPVHEILYYGISHSRDNIINYVVANNLL